MTVGAVLLALVLALAVVGCSFGEKEPPQGSFELPNGRSLYMACLGSGSPTIVLEAGAATPGVEMSEVQERLSSQYMTCIYDRANIGSSGKAPTPRTAAEVVTDLHQLLQTADVPSPYVLAGYGNGAFFLQLYGRRYPDEVVGAVAMSPPPPVHPWLERVLPRFNEEERKEELAYFRGENPEQIDWFASSKELKNAPAPPPIPFEMLIHTEKACAGEPPCLKSYDIYEEVMREIAQEEWPQGRFHQVATYRQEIHKEKPDLVVDTVKRVASK